MSESLKHPEPGSTWQHRNGQLYAVLCIANEFDEPRYPKTVVYQGQNGKIWARRFDDWHRSMTLALPASVSHV
ncbi:DUF1653 domain-containing protein [Roseomonas sp. USHLN139]|uniref:DUF1653 domain-containing protein n=1 Tax=Roseomonas sp. USHLN139 TaxID=3081298 RepID=UPI003B01DADD